MARVVLYCLFVCVLLGTLSICVAPNSSLSRYLLWGYSNRVMPFRCPFHARSKMDHTGNDKNRVILLWLLAVASMSTMVHAIRRRNSGNEIGRLGACCWMLPGQRGFVSVSCARSCFLVLCGLVCTKYNATNNARLSSFLRYRNHPRDFCISLATAPVYIGCS